MVSQGDLLLRFQPVQPLGQCGRQSTSCRKKCDPIPNTLLLDHRRLCVPKAGLPGLAHRSMEEGRAGQGVGLPRAEEPSMCSSSRTVAFQDPETHRDLCPRPGALQEAVHWWGSSGAAFPPLPIALALWGAYGAHTSATPVPCCCQHASCQHCGVCSLRAGVLSLKGQFESCFGVLEQLH